MKSEYKPNPFLFGLGNESRGTIILLERRVWFPQNQLIVQFMDCLEGRLTNENASLEKTTTGENEQRAGKKSPASLRALSLV